jgi:hypothetical protein
VPPALERRSTVTKEAVETRARSTPDTFHEKKFGESPTIYMRLHKPRITTPRAGRVILGRFLQQIIGGDPLTVFDQRKRATNFLL